MWWRHRTPQRNKPEVNSDLYHKSVNDIDGRQKLLNELIELATIRWTHEHVHKGIWVNRRYQWNTKHPYIKRLLKKKLVKLVRDHWFTSSHTLLTYKEIIVAAKYITEVLREINMNTELFNTEYKKVGNGGPLGTLFFHAFTKSGKFVLPAGEPPFRPSQEPIGMTPGQFITEIRKFGYFINMRLTPAKREMLFVQLCECIHPDEVKILLAIKEQKLHELYPNITVDAVVKAGFIDPKDAIEVAPVVEKARPGRPKKSKEIGVSENLLEDESPE